LSEPKTIEYPARLKHVLEQALKDPEEFWGKAAKSLHWFKPWNRVFEWNYPDFKWFSGGMTNLSYNCLERNVLIEGRGTKPAIVWESGETGQSRVLTYNELLNDVKSLASTLRAFGVRTGDRVTIYMPMKAL
jgi:acetyl-CoA synthetase